MQLPDATAGNPNGNKTFLAGGVNTYFINGKPVVNNILGKLKISPSRVVFFSSLFKSNTCLF